MLRVIGLMSGTSLDGVDAAWLTTDGVEIGELGPTLTLPYDASLRAELRDLLGRATALSVDDPFLARVVGRVTAVHVAAVAALGREADLIGFHGQTILHQPARRRTWQIGNAALLARQTGIAVAHDFRSADVAAGGQGAPLAPAYHAALARDLAKPLVVLNIGGVANVTWIGSDGRLVAFDTGPGNGPLDDWAMRHTGRPLDCDGALSAAGRADREVLARLLANPYFQAPPPKSLDRLDFSLDVSGQLAASGIESLSPADGAATLVAFIAATVALAGFPEPPLRFLVTGGGRRNPSILQALRAALSVPAEPVEAVGWGGDALEAQCFGYLAARTLRGLPITWPQTTGAPRPLPGGAIVRP
jgi:anhydro-N-acetylmuramic acid kinase